MYLTIKTKQLGWFMSNVLNDNTNEKRKRNNSFVNAGNSSLFAGAIFSKCTFNMGTTVYRSVRLTWELLYTEVCLHFVLLKDSDYCQNAMKKD